MEPLSKEITSCTCVYVVGSTIVDPRPCADASAMPGASREFASLCVCLRWAVGLLDITRDISGFLGDRARVRLATLATAARSVGRVGPSTRCGTICSSLSAVWRGKFHSRQLDRKQSLQIQ